MCRAIEGDWVMVCIHNGHQFQVDRVTRHRGQIRTTSASWEAAPDRQSRQTLERNAQKNA